MCEIKNAYLKLKPSKQISLTPYHEYNIFEDGTLWETRIEGYAIYCKHDGGEWELTPVLKKRQYLKVPKDSWITTRKMV